METNNSLKSRKVRLGDRYFTAEELEVLMAQAVRNALAEHKAAGNPVAEWRDGKVVIVQPEDIDLSVFDEQPTSKSPE